MKLKAIFCSLIILLLFLPSVVLAEQSACFTEIKLFENSYKGIVVVEAYKDDVVVSPPLLLPPPPPEPLAPLLFPPSEPERFKTNEARGRFLPNKARFITDEKRGKFLSNEKEDSAVWGTGSVVATYTTKDPNTGLLIASARHIDGNKYVVYKLKRTILGFERGHFYPAKVIKRFDNDVIILGIEIPKEKEREFGVLTVSQDVVVEGIKVASIGHPNGFINNIGSGIVAGFGDESKYSLIWEEAVYHSSGGGGGKSGAPVFNLCTGEIIAIHVGSYFSSKGFSLSISVPFTYWHIKEALKEIETEK